MKENFRTDLAREVRGEYMKEYSKKHKGEPDGIEYEEKKAYGIGIQTVTVLDERGKELLGKPVGKYVTLDVGKLWTSDYEKFKHAADELSAVLSSLGKGSSVLVAGLGNRYVTPDAVGPLTVHNVICTRHIKKHDRAVYEMSGLGDVSAIVPGVLAQTGIEASEQIKSAVKEVKPDLVIVVDALASKNVSSLASTVQITDTGISPGSGVGNDRGEISQKILGVPTLAVGVPTIVDTSTLLWSALEENTDDAEEIFEKVRGNFKSCYVTVNDADCAVEEVSRLIGYAINKTYHKVLSYEDMMYM